MDMISHLPIEIRLQILKRFINLMAISDGMKKELHRQWFDFFLNYAHKLFQDRKYGQCDDIVFFMLDTVIETKPFPFDGFENTDDMLDFFFLYTSYPFSTDTK